MLNILLRSHLVFFGTSRHIKAHETNYALKSVRGVCKQDIEMYNWLKNSLKSCKFSKFCYWKR